jgi:predicted transporter
MKKILILAVVSLFILGCNHTQEAQIAQGMGDVAAVAWVAMDHPVPQEVQAVAIAINLIDQNVISSTNNGTWYTKLMPVVAAQLPASLKKAGIPVTTLPMAELGIAAMLSGIDSAFAIHPDWNKDIDTAAMMIHAFNTGALNGLGRPSTDPVVVAAMQQRAMRATMRR